MATTLETDVAGSAAPDGAAMRRSWRRSCVPGALEGHDELAEGSVAVAAPILAADGIVGAVGIVGPAFRCDAGCIERVRLALPAVARADRRRPRLRGRLSVDQRWAGVRAHRSIPTSWEWDILPLDTLLQRPQTSAP